jgi:hypothetical protein
VAKSQGGKVVSQEYVDNARAAAGLDKQQDMTQDQKVVEQKHAEFKKANEEIKANFEKSIAEKDAGKKTDCPAAQ